MDRRIEAATAAMRLAEAAMSQLVEQDPALGRLEATRVVLQQLRVALAELQVAAEPGVRPGEASGQPAGSGGQPLPDRATEGRPPIDA